MSNSFALLKHLLTILGVVILTSSGILSQTPDCRGQNQPSVNGSRPSSLNGAPANVHGAGGAKAHPSNGSGVSTGQPGKDSAPLPSQHKVYLSWKASTSPNVVGYNIYRRQGSGEFQKLNLALIRGTNCVDSSVQDRQTYTYRARAFRAIDQRESLDSNEAPAYIPGPGSDRSDASPESGAASTRRPIQ